MYGNQPKIFGCRYNLLKFRDIHRTLKCSIGSIFNFNPSYCHLDTQYHWSLLVSDQSAKENWEFLIYGRIYCRMCAVCPHRLRGDVLSGSNANRITPGMPPNLIN